MSLKKSRATEFFSELEGILNNPPHSVEPAPSVQPDFHAIFGSLCLGRFGQKPGLYPRDEGRADYCYGVDAGGIFGARVGGKRESCHSFHFSSARFTTHPMYRFSGAKAGEKDLWAVKTIMRCRE